MNALFGASDSKKQACGARVFNISGGNPGGVESESAPRELGKLVNAKAKGIFPFVESVCVNSAESLLLCQHPAGYPPKENAGITHVATIPTRARCEWSSRIRR